MPGRRVLPPLPFDRSATFDSVSVRARAPYPRFAERVLFGSAAAGAYPLYVVAYRRASAPAAPAEMAPRSS